MKSRNIKKGFVIGIIILFVGAVILPSTIGKTRVKTAFICIKTNGYIQDLINNASIGDTINIPSGTYFENIKINKTINLVGENKDTTIIMPSSITRDVVEITADWVNLSGFTIRKCGEGSYGIGIISNHNNIRDNNISDNYDIGIGVIGDYNLISDNEIFSNEQIGIELEKTSYNTIEGNKISNNPIGINIIDSLNNVINANKISNNEYGIEIDYSSEINTIKFNTITLNYNSGIEILGENNTINQNTISNNKCGINLDSSNNQVNENTFINDGIYVYTTKHNEINDNTVNGKSLVYLEDESDMIINSNAGQVILVNCDKITIRDLEIIETYTGIILVNSNNCLITNNNINSNNENGIDLYRSSSNEIKENTLSNNEIGIYLLNSHNDNTISENTIDLNNFYGIVLSSSDNNEIKKNTIDSNSGYGINIIISESNEITSNNISKNTLGIGILSTESYGNNIYHNNFINNDESAHDNSDIGNNWDDGVYGNYWSDYKEKYPNAKKNRKEGVWDTPYEIPGRDNVDNRPLIKQWPKYSTTKNTKTTEYLILKWLFERFPILERMLLSIR